MLFQNISIRHQYCILGITILLLCISIGSYVYPAHNTVQRQLEYITSTSTSNSTPTESVGQSYYDWFTSIGKQYVCDRTANTPTQSSIRTAILSTYHTPDNTVLPSYINYYVNSCGALSASVDCYIVTILSDTLYNATVRQYNKRGINSIYDEYDIEIYNELYHSGIISIRCRDMLNDPVPDNVHLLAISETTFDYLLDTRLPGANSTVYKIRGRKVIDLKPTYAQLFADNIIDLSYDKYTHWAFSDVDEILGDITRHLSVSHDIWTFHGIYNDWNPPRVTGQLTVLHNTERMRTLWYDAAQVIRPEVLTIDVIGFDEIGFGDCISALTSDVHRVAIYHAMLMDNIAREWSNRQWHNYFYTYEYGHIYAHLNMYPDSPAPYQRIEAVLFHNGYIKTWMEENSCDTLDETWQSPVYNITMCKTEPKVQMINPAWPLCHDNSQFE